MFTINENYNVDFVFSDDITSYNTIFKNISTSLKMLFDSNYINIKTNFKYKKNTTTKVLINNINLSIDEEFNNIKQLQNEYSENNNDSFWTKIKKCENNILSNIISNITNKSEYFISSNNVKDVSGLIKENISKISKQDCSSCSKGCCAS